MRDIVALFTTKIIYVVKNSFRACATKKSYAPGGQQWSTAGSVSQGMVPAGARAAKREVRVCARGRSLSHATMRSILMAAAIATCCKWVFATPQYRVRRRPKARTPWESVPSTPATPLIELLACLAGRPRLRRLQRLSLVLGRQPQPPARVLGPGTTGPYGTRLTRVLVEFHNDGATALPTPMLPPRH
jgi:hypothetical protein